MKIFKQKSLFVVVLMALFASCDPIENRDELTNSFNPDNIDLQVVQSTPGGNQLSIQMNTPGIAGYWDYIIDRKYSDRVEVVFPIPGLQTFTYHVTTPYMPFGNTDSIQYITKTVQVQVDVLDHELPPAYYSLVGADLAGKTWVFDGTGGDGGLWWYMVSPTNINEVWWNAGGSCCPPSDATGKMVFDLDGGANFTYYKTPADAAVTGSTWAFNSDYTKLTIKGGADILGSEGCGTNGKVFEIKELSADKLKLFISNGTCNSGWIWVFVPESTK